jgi:hypothetical protein
MDSHHNGFIIEAYLRYHEATGHQRYAETVETALDFYRHRLFEADGAPNFDESSRYPRDIHAATQGIIVFALAGEAAFARRIIDWTLATLYAGQGQFYYQKRRLYTKEFTLMRWCQAWMAYALAEYLTATAGDSPAADSALGVEENRPASGSEVGNRGASRGSDGGLSTAVDGTAGGQ